jgi:UDP-N-acetylmuramoylalanine--D-glutamate ligase
MIDLGFLKGQKIGVLGLGKTGQATVDALKEAKIDYIAFDDEQGGDIFDEAVIKTLDRIILSPGIPHTYPQPHPAIELAKQHNIPFVSDIALLREAYPNNPFYVVTGTNGKSTTTALLAHILEAQDEVRMGGNIGHAVLAMQPPKNHTTPFVLEMSSYQIEITPNLAPDAAILLNITPDHLARHGGLQGYVAAKKQIFQKAGKSQLAVIGVDDPHSHVVAEELKKQDWVVEEISVKSTEQRFVYDEFKVLKGDHNRQNIDCAAAVARFTGMDDKAIAAQIKSFGGLAHRQFFVRKIGEVSYINDSKATNADAVSHALNAFDEIYWIVGGQSKEGGLEGLQVFKSKIRKAFLIGEAQEEFAGWCDIHQIDFERCDTLDIAVTEAHKAAQKNNQGTVLLSPACASWDQFKSFEHRGEMFQALVEAL